MPVILLVAMGYILFDILTSKGASNELETLPRDGVDRRGNNGHREPRDGSPEHREPVTPAAAAPGDEPQPKTDNNSPPVSTDKK